nr:hypothetical protein [Tanacetum cinerariifolium]
MGSIKDLLRTCPYHGFTELHQLDTFYNALNPADQDSLNSAADGNLLERRTQDVLTIIENKSKIAKLTHAVNQQTSDVTNAMTAILKQFQATPPPASVKAVEEIYVTCGGAHLYYQCLAADGNTFSEFQDNIQGYVLAAANVKNNQNRFSQPQGYNRGTNFNQDSSYQALMQQNQVVPLTTLANPKGELTAITTRSGLVLDGHSIPMPPPFINPEEDERVEETLTDPELDEFTIKVPPPLVQKAKPPSQRNNVVHQRNPLHPNISYPSRMHKQKQQDKDEIQIHKFWQMFKQLHINITLADALILILKYQKMHKALLSNKEKLLELANTPLNENCLACKALADLGASINLMPFSIWKKLGLPELISTCMTLELANRSTYTPAGIVRDVFVLVGKFTFPADFVIVDYESDPRVPLILGRPFLRIARALIDVHGEEMVLHDGNNDLLFDINSDLREIEYLLNHDPTKEMDSILEDSIDADNLADPNDNLFDTIPEMFTDEHTLDYSSPLLYDEYDDDLFELESDNDDAYNDPFDSKGEKIKDSKVWIDELDLPRSSDFLPSPEYDSFLFEEFSEVDALPSTTTRKKYLIRDFDPPLFELPFHKEVPRSETLLSFSLKNEEKVFKPGILTSKGVHTSLLLELSY